MPTKYSEQGIRAAQSYDQRYARGGWTYDEAYEKEVLRTFVIGKAGWKAGDSVLEIGCGKGLHSYLLSQLGMRVIGIDVSRVAIDHAKKKYNAATIPQLSFMAADLTSYEPEYPCKGILSRGMSWYHYELDGTGSTNVPKETKRLFSWLEVGGVFVLQISTDFSGSRPRNAVHNNRLEDYLNLFRPLGQVVWVSDWRGREITPRTVKNAAAGILIATRKTRKLS